MSLDNLLKRFKLVDTAGVNEASVSAGGAVKVDNSAVTQPVSGTVTANAGTGTFNIQSNASVNLAQVSGSVVATAATGIAKVGLTDGTGTAITSTTNALDINIKSGNISGFATATNQTGGSQKTQVVDGSGNIVGSTGNALDINIKSGNPTTMTVTQGTASNLKAQVQQLNGVSTSATLQNAVSATGNGSTMSIDGYASVIFEVTGTFSATVTFQGSRDGGTTFYTIDTLKLGTDTVAGTTTATGLYQAQCSGLTHIQAAVTWTSGTSVTVKATADPNTFAPHSVNIGNNVTVTQATAANLKVDLSGTAANATAIKVDGSAVTQPISAASLPTHPVTQSGNWTTRIVGNAGSTVDAAVGAGTAPTNMVAAGGVYNSTEISPSNTQSAALQLDSKGRVRQVLMDAAGNTRGANVNASNQLSVSVDNTPAVSQSGTWNIGTVTTITNAVNAAQSGTWTVQPGNTANTTPWLVTPTPATSGGASFTAGSIGATKTAVKASAGQLYGWYFYNSNTTVSYVQIFNVASGSVTLGTTTPDLSIGIPAGAAANVWLDGGLAFGTAITIAITTTRTGSTGPTNTVDYNVWYK